METRVTEIADGIYQLTTHVAESPVDFNQILVAGLSATCVVSW